MNQSIPQIFSKNRPLACSYPPVLEIHDNFFPLHLVDNLENLLFSTQFNYSQELTTHFTPTDNKDIGFYRSLYNHETTWISPVIGETMFPFLEPLYYFTTQSKLIIKNILFARIFLQPPSPSPGPQKIHLDAFEPHMVFLYYINDSDGDTYFYNDNGEVIKQISPKKGRMVWFDGSYYHCGSRPKTSTRAILNIDIILNK